eukprot:TRINITY_DN12037_c0_g1_i2.p1 TRINITY_DN12037_c0_g1~~TRINITY_DN12037_c0_g1_i2.p1  ORF type:complete len:134 (-),score=32.12 TRINITY_DN12037_c0_g1_i2:43-396(-)
MCIRDRYDIEWSPYSSTVFASVARDGRLELWDLKESLLDPIYKDKPAENAKWPMKTVVKFSRHNPILLTGDADGDIQVNRIHGLDGGNEKEENEKLIKVLYPNGYQRMSREQNESTA